MSARITIKVQVMESLPDKVIFARDIDVIVDTPIYADFDVNKLFEAIQNDLGAAIEKRYGDVR